jgi:hypothetical protein
MFRRGSLLGLAVVHLKSSGLELGKDCSIHKIGRADSAAASGPFAQDQTRIGRGGDSEEANRLRVLQWYALHGVSLDRGINRK